MTTILNERGAFDCSHASAGDGALWLSPADTRRATGWERKPEGMCRGETCVPIPPGREAEFLDDGRIDVAAFWRHLGKPIAASEDADVWYLGESADEHNEALLSLEAPDFTLPDFSGQPHSLHDFRGKKVLLITWASW